MDLLILALWCFLGILALIPIGNFFPWLLHSLRFLAAYFFIFFGMIAVIIGIALQDIAIFMVCFFSAIWAGLQFIFLPKTSPSFVKKYNLRW